MLDLILRLNKRFSDADKESAIPTIQKIINFAYLARREGVLALEAETDEEENYFLKTGLMLIVDGTDPDLVRAILERLLLADEHTDAELLIRLLSIEGVLSIQQGENPYIILIKLGAMLGEKYLPEIQKMEPEDITRHAYEFLHTLRDKKAWDECKDFEAKLLSYNYGPYISGNFMHIIKNLTLYDLVYALCGCSYEAITAVLRCTSQRRFVHICDEIERIADPMMDVNYFESPAVLRYQDKILKTIARLEDAGQIFSR